MSQKLIDHSPDLKRLRDEGYALKINPGFLVLEQIPYVNNNKEIKYGTLVMGLNQAGNKAAKPPDHTAWFAGEHPCDHIGKPITPEKVRAAFEKAQQINQTLPNVEISCNFIMDEELPPTHTESLLSLLRPGSRRASPKGSIYLSPLKFASPSREVLYDFYKLKSLSRFPTFLYLIQRL